MSKKFFLDSIPVPIFSRSTIRRVRQIEKKEKKHGRENTHGYVVHASCVMAVVTVSRDAWCLSLHQTIVKTKKKKTEKEKTHKNSFCPGIPI